MRAEQVTPPVTDHGEGPVLLDGRIAFVDMLAGDVLRLADDGTVERWHVGTVAAAVRPRRNGGCVVARADDFALYDEWGGPASACCAAGSPAGVRFNEGGCAPDGAFFCGTVAYDAHPGAGAMYRLDPDRTVSAVAHGLTLSNGLSFLGDHAVYVDSATRTVQRWEWSPESGLGVRDVIVRIAPEDGTPDGLCVDAEGGIWVALWDGSMVRRYGPDGSLTAQIDVPVAHVTACAFGGDDLQDLYITTSCAGGDPHPAAGALFVARPGVRGTAPLDFGA